MHYAINYFLVEIPRRETQNVLKLQSSAVCCGFAVRCSMVQYSAVRIMNYIELLIIIL
jgi:hypothetical protein